MATEPPTIDPKVLRRATNVLTTLTDLNDLLAAAAVAGVWSEVGHAWGRHPNEGAAGTAIVSMQHVAELAYEQVAAGNCDTDHLLGAVSRAQAALALGIVLATDNEAAAA